VNLTKELNANLEVKTAIYASFIEVNYWYREEKVINLKI
jgi:hypothetical protein